MKLITVALYHKRDYISNLQKRNQVRSKMEEGETDHFFQKEENSFCEFYKRNFIEICFTVLLHVSLKILFSKYPFTPSCLVLVTFSLFSLVLLRLRHWFKPNFLFEKYSFTLYGLIRVFNHIERVKEPLFFHLQILSKFIIFTSRKY